MSGAFVHIENLNVSYRRNVVLKGLSWTIKKGEQWLLSGASGSGKTTLAKVIAGLVQTNASIEINHTGAQPARTMYVAQWFPFKDKTGSSNFYYQQRYNSTEAEDCHTVWEELSLFCSKINEDEERLISLLQALALFHRKDAPLIQLSSGEHKKLQLTKGLLLRPGLLILDNPYTGLDVATRGHLNRLLDEACAEGMQLIMISNDGEYASCINQYARLNQGKLETSTSAFDEEEQLEEQHLRIPDFLFATADEDEDLVVLNNVTVSYGTKRVLDNINWTVKRGDKWLLSGPNGSGKSTLLSLLTGDNPQAYANEIYLFGRKRGTGESIWDIKKQIGYISPELQWFFDPASTVFQAIASGLFDTAGLFKAVSPAQALRVRELMQLMNLSNDEHTLLTNIPLGKQRMALLARAIIKNPPLLILDEPCQGLDQQQTRLFNKLVDILCANNRTLIYVGHFEHRLPACISDQLSLNKGVATLSAHHIREEIST